jgi:hypothetical protein
MTSRHKPPIMKASDGATRDWTKVLKGATPEAVAKALLQPRKPIKPRPK